MYFCRIVARFNTVLSGTWFDGFVIFWLLLDRDSIPMSRIMTLACFGCSKQHQMYQSQMMDGFVSLLSTNINLL